MSEAADKRYFRKKKAGKKAWSVFRFIILFGLGFVILYPLIYMVSCSFRERGDMNDPTVMWIPRRFTFGVIADTMKAMDYWSTLGNTLLLNIGCSLVQVISCALTGYGFARYSFKGKKLLFGVVILMILVPTQVISLPLYAQFRYFGIQGDFFGAEVDWTVNLIDSMATMYLPAMTANGICSGLMIFIFRQFFKSLPKELEDAACIDGCGPLGVFVRVMAPNAGAAFLTVFLFSVVWYWNDYYVSSTFFVNNRTVALMLQNLDTHLKMMLFNDATVEISPREQIVWKEAGCLLSIVPVLTLYLVLQRHFTEGITRSGIVG